MGCSPACHCKQQPPLDGKSKCDSKQVQTPGCPMRVKGEAGLKYLVLKRYTYMPEYARKS